MGNLGKKITKRTRRLGKKFDNKIHKLGNKTNNVLHKIENVNDKIITKSGKALNIAKKVVGTADKVVGVLNDAGVRNVPILGTATSAVEVGLHNSKKGLDKADKLRDKYIKHSQKALQKGHNVGNALEKQNTRKFIAQQLADDNEDSFA